MVAGTIDAYLPPGHPDPYKKGNRDDFIEGQKSRKYSSWDVMEQKVTIDAGSRKILNQKNQYVIDPTERY